MGTSETYNKLAKDFIQGVIDSGATDMRTIDGMTESQYDEVLIAILARRQKIRQDAGDNVKVVNTIIQLADERLMFRRENNKPNPYPRS